MNSPHTGKPMPIMISKGVIDFKEESFTINYMYYVCNESESRFTDEDLDKLNLYQAHQQYAQKHNIPMDNKGNFLPRSSVLSASDKGKLLAEKIIKRLVEKDINKQEFAYLMGVSPSNVTKWLNGFHNFTIETLFDIEVKLQITLFDIYT